MSAPGKDLESLAARILRATAQFDGPALVSVEENVMLPGPDGPRQIDVVVRSLMGPFDLMTIVECKDTTRKVTVTQVDALHDVMRDVGANHAALVTRGGYSKTAVHKARRLGISLLRADHLVNLEEQILGVPICVRETVPTDLAIEVRSSKEEPGTRITISVKDLLAPNGLNLPELARAHLLDSDRFPPTDDDAHYAWSVSDQLGTVVLTLADGRQVELDWMTVTWTCATTYYYGLVSDFSKAMFLKDEVDDSKGPHVLVAAEDFIVDYRSELISYARASELPGQPVIEAQVALVPDDVFTIAAGASLRAYEEGGEQLAFTEVAKPIDGVNAPPR